MADLAHVVLMGDPSHFSVVGGANPHTRDRWGRRKIVDRDLAIRQWHHLHDLLRDLGLYVHVIPPDPRHPGLVYPANAGARIGDDFVLSNLVPSREGELPSYRHAVESLGLACHTLASRFEGEADLFPAGDVYLSTCGEIQRQRFVPRLGWPPWRRIYGFRSEPAALDEIERRFPLEHEAMPLALVDERYYHGDTCLCSFGPGRRFLLAYLPALAPESAEILRARFRERLVQLSELDAETYAANSLHLEVNGEPILIMPRGISTCLEESVRTRDTRVIQVDVSEFKKKGGGSVKCMVGDLGKIPQSAVSCSE
jgi:N-dimethylarginine dimethylaminohydrolase